MDEASKPCRHCRSPIHAKARRCGHCLGYQGWLASQSDPRFFLWIFGPFIAFGIVMSLFTHFFREDVSLPDVKFTQVETYVRPEPPGHILYVVGEVAPGVALAGEEECIAWRVSVSDEAGKLVDTFERSKRITFGAAGESVPFRLSGTLAADPEKAAKIVTKMIDSECRRDD